MKNTAKNWLVARSRRLNKGLKPLARLEGYRGWWYSQLQISPKRGVQGIDKEVQDSS